VIVQRVQHYPAGDHLDLAAPEQLGSCLPVYVLLSDGRAAVDHLRSQALGGNHRLKSAAYIREDRMICGVAASEAVLTV